MLWHCSDTWTIVVQCSEQISNHGHNNTHAADTLWTIVVQCSEQISNHGHNNTHANDTLWTVQCSAVKCAIITHMLWHTVNDSSAV